MADAKITALTNYTTPIGTDVLPIVDVTNVVTKKIQANILPAVLNAPEGFLINGVITPSVASNNLTVAIKTLAGNDPSASDPVYVRLGGVIRSITAALTFTNSTRTNWVNAASAELAGQEIDYFVYLGWNGSSLVLTAARIPYGATGSDFDSNGTHEKSDINNALSPYNTTVTVVNIGRFAATLASSTYYWSVPTFTASNLIQRPIYETRWLTWSPQYSAGGSMTFGSVSNTVVIYKIRNDTVQLDWLFTGTTGGSANIFIYGTLPFSYSNTASVVCEGYDSTISSRIFYSDLVNSNQAEFLTNNAANWGIGSGRQIFMEIFYDIA